MSNERKAGAGLAAAHGSGHGREERNFRWAYALLVELAKVELEAANSEAKAGEWPAGQEWHELGGSSKACFLAHARKRVGIPDDEFLADIRSGLYEVDDLFASDQNKKMSNSDPEKTS